MEKRKKLTVPSPPKWLVDLREERLKQILEDDILLGLLFSKDIEAQHALMEEMKKNKNLKNFYLARLGVLAYAMRLMPLFAQYIEELIKTLQKNGEST